ATVANVLVGPGGSQGLALGNQPARTIQLDAQGEVTGINDLDGTAYALTYQPDGTPATIQKNSTTYTFEYDDGGPGPAPGPAGPTVLGWFRAKVSAAVDTATTFVADTAQATGQVIRNAFVRVTAAGRDFVAKASEVWQAGVTNVTWLVDQAGNQLLAVGDQVVNASKEAAQAFAQNLEQFGKPFTDLWQQLQGFGGAAARVLQAIVNDPGAFFGHLAAGVGGGLQSFINGLSQTLPQQLLQWLTGNLSSLPPLPQDLSDVKEVGGWLLQVFRL